MSYCDQHGVQVQRLEDLKTDLDKGCAQHRELWSGLKEKVSMKLFLLFVAVYLGSFSFNLLIYNTIKAVQLNVAVIETTLDAHMIEDRNRNK